MREQKLGGQALRPDDISQDGKDQGAQRHATRRQPIHTVRKVDGVRCAGHHQHRNDHERQRAELEARLVERHGENLVRGQRPRFDERAQYGEVGAAVVVYVKPEHHAEPHLKQKLFVYLQAVARVRSAPGRQFQPVVDCTEHAEPNQAYQPHLHVEVGQVGEQEYGQRDRTEHEHAAHRRHVALVAHEFVERRMIEFRSIPRFPLRELPDHTRCQQQHKQKAKQRCARTAEERILVRVVSTLQ